VIKEASKKRTKFKQALNVFQKAEAYSCNKHFKTHKFSKASGIELARILSGRNLGRSPSIIFTTAFDQFALEGYKPDVIDYLLKPFGYEDFIRAASKALSLNRLQINSVETSSKEED